MVPPLTVRETFDPLEEGNWRRLEGQLSVLPNFTNSAKIFHIIKKFNLNVKTIFKSSSFQKQFHRHGGVEVVRSPRMRESCVRSPVATDLSRKNRL